MDREKLVSEHAPLGRDVMRALIMAAGLGTRLRPLTNHCPKPLVPLKGRPMVEYVLDHLANQGVKEAIINVHYLPHMMRSFVKSWNEKGKRPYLEIQDEEAKILGSGGAVALASRWLFDKNEVALVCNADVIAKPNLPVFLESHQRNRDQKGVECTLAVMPHLEAGKKYTGLDIQDHLVYGFITAGTGTKNLFHFPGFYLLDKVSIKRLPSNREEFSILDGLWRPLVEEKKLGAWLYDGEFLDLGTPGDLQIAEQFL